LNLIVPGLVLELIGLIDGYSFVLVT
jgi:hypothetical protein